MDSKKLTQAELDEKIAEIRKKNAERDRKRALVEEDKRKAEKNNASVTLKPPSNNEKRDPNYKPTLYCDKIDLTEEEILNEESAATHQEDLENKTSRKNANENARNDKAKPRYADANVPKWRRKPIDDTKWRDERKKIDEDRIRRHRNKEGEWRREWDVHKDMNAPSVQSGVSDSNRNAFNNDKSSRNSLRRNHQIKNDSSPSEMSVSTHGIPNECENALKGEVQRCSRNEENRNKTTCEASRYDPKGERADLMGRPSLESSGQRERYSKLGTKAHLENKDLQDRHSYEPPHFDPKRENAHHRPTHGPLLDSAGQRERNSKIRMKAHLENKNYQDKNTYVAPRSNQKCEQVDLQPIHEPSHEYKDQPVRYVAIRKEGQPENKDFRENDDYQDKNSYGVRHIDQKRDHANPHPTHGHSRERYENFRKDRLQMSNDHRDSNSYSNQHGGHKYKGDVKSETNRLPQNERNNPFNSSEDQQGDQKGKHVDPRLLRGPSYKSSDKIERHVKIEMEQLSEDEDICNESTRSDWNAADDSSQVRVHLKSDQSVDGAGRIVKTALPSIPEENIDGREYEDPTAREIIMPEFPRFPENNQAYYPSEMNLPQLPNYPKENVNWQANENKPVYYVQQLPSYPEDINWQRDKNTIPYMLPSLPRYPEPNTNWQPNAGPVPYFNPPPLGYPEGNPNWHPPDKGQVPYMLPPLPRYPENNPNWQPNNCQVPYLMPQFPSYPVANTSWQPNRFEIPYLMSQFPKYPEIDADWQQNKDQVPYETKNSSLPNYPEENIPSEENDGSHPHLDERYHQNTEESIQRTVTFDDDVKKKAFVVNFNNNTEETKSNRVNLRDQIYGGGCAQSAQVKYTPADVANAKYRDTLHVYPDLAEEENIPNLYAKSILNDSDVEKNDLKVHLADDTTHRRRSTLMGENRIKVELSVDIEKAGQSKDASFRSVIHSAANAYKAPSGTLHEKFSDQ